MAIQAAFHGDLWQDTDKILTKNNGRPIQIGLLISLRTAEFNDLYWYSIKNCVSAAWT